MDKEGIEGGGDGIEEVWSREEGGRRKRDGEEKGDG